MGDGGMGGGGDGDGGWCEGTCGQEETIFFFFGLNRYFKSSFPDTHYINKLFLLAICMINSRKGSVYMRNYCLEKIGQWWYAQDRR